MTEHDLIGNCTEFKVGDPIIFTAMGNFVIPFDECLRMFLSQGLIRHATTEEMATGRRL